MIASNFRCMGCDGDIPHVHASDDECESNQGACDFLVKQGARPVWIRIESATPRGPHLMSRTGWLCKKCAKEYKWR